MIVGIDPDIDKSGVASTIDGKKIAYSCLTFVETIDRIKDRADEIKCVYIEAGWLNKKSNWHDSQSVSVASKIGKNVGENHATGKLLAQIIEALGVKVILVKPTTKKYSAEEFNFLTGCRTRTNQEARDAVMMIFGRTS